MKIKKNIFCLIPARSGSKRINNKNIKKLNGLELFSHTIIFAKKFPSMHICFSTDSEKYQKIAKKFMEVDDLRPKNLSGDFVKTYNVLKYELLRVEKRLNKKFDFLVLLQPTVPYRKKSDMQKAINIIKNKNVDSVVSITPVLGGHPLRMKVIQNSYVLNYSKEKNENMEPIQKLPKVYLRSGSIYMIKRNAFFKYKNLLGKKVKPIILKDKYAINIDNVEDLNFAKKYK
jgi:N-acylneuraminate cytidylyltransferase/CMP-N,N'-diacetyllegionaminic acid synthase